ncbi:uncharacterized protein LOC133915780 [Phragmites australis]|uniref:uncharacterized protein LOC133915780 n=1 Tax=Phragmites australis TaxID=29695 RepID=UPI002D771916|nr:uncharacterized protein LOC133915780 [Phragmites australis]
MAVAEISAVLYLLLAATGERDPPARGLCSLAARSRFEDLAGALTTGPPANPAAARAVVCPPSLLSQEAEFDLATTIEGAGYYRDMYHFSIKISMSSAYVLL